jgi:hypothetical protein
MEISFVNRIVILSQKSDMPLNNLLLLAIINCTVQSHYFKTWSAATPIVCGSYPVLGTYAIIFQDLESIIPFWQAMNKWQIRGLLPE